MAKSWFVIETKTLHEFLAARRIADQGFQSFLPTTTIHFMQHNKAATRSVPLYSRYLFARFDLHERGWQAIWNTRGVTRILGNDAPLPVADELIDEIRAYTGQVEQPLTPGERVIIRDGTWRGAEGLFAEDEGERVRVLMSFLGKKFPISFEKRQLQRKETV